MNTSKIRKDFPALKQRIGGKRLVYFDNACSVLKPKPVIAAVNNFYSNFGSCAGNRSSHLLGWRVQELMEEAREKAAKFIGARSEKEVVWTKNSTEGINLIAASLPLENGRNEIVLTEMEHHSNLLPFFEQSQKRKFKIKIVPLDKDGMVNLDLLDKAVTKKTALVAATHLSNVTGLVSPMDDIVNLAHKKGALVLADDAQYVVSHRENAAASRIDFLVFSGHKIGGPTGIGVLYGREALLKKMPPYNAGGGMVKSVSISGGNIKVNYLPPPFKFEAGVQHNAGIAGLGFAIDYLEYLGGEKIENYLKSLVEYVLRKLSERPEIGFMADYGKHPPSSLVSFYFRDKRISLYDFNLFLNHELRDCFIATRCGHHCAMPYHKIFNVPVSMRLSFFVYNTKQEIDVFCQALDKFLSKK
jgi:cysteine desulfurase/selenocysteine lyase